MIELTYRKIEQCETGKIMELVARAGAFHIGNEDRILKNWNNIEAIGGFQGKELIAILITDPYNPVRWNREEKKNYGLFIRKIAFLLEPVIKPALLSYNEEITMELMEAYFDSLTYCDEIILYTTADPANSSRRECLGKTGFTPDGRLPKKMVLRTGWTFFSERKIRKINDKIRSFLQKTGLPCNDIDTGLIYTELLEMIIYILVDLRKEEYCSIKFFGYIAGLNEISDELIKFLLQLNFDSHYGSFSIDRDWNILVMKNKLGPDITEKDIELSIKSIAMAMSKYSEAIICRFGEENLLDAILIKKPDFPVNYRYLLEGYSE